MDVVVRTLPIVAVRRAAAVSIGAVLAILAARQTKTVTSLPACVPPLAPIRLRHAAMGSAVALATAILSREGASPVAPDRCAAGVAAAHQGTAATSMGQRCAVRPLRLG